MKKLFTIIIICMSCISCPAVRKVPIAGLELVMAEGDKVIATTKAGKIEILAWKGLNRSYTWDGATRSVELGGRAERWYGSLGAYYPGPGNHWKNHQGITRGVLQEGQQHFSDEAAAQKWIDQQSEWYATVYSNSGLLVSYDKIIERRQLNVEVWQLYIGGKKPTKLKGASDSLVILRKAPK